MASDFKLPDLGENIDSADVVNVLVKVGDEIRAEQGVLEIETEKAVVEVPAPRTGRVAKVYVKKGDTIHVGQPLIALDDDAKSNSPAADSTRPAAAPAEKASKPPPRKAAVAEKPTKPVQQALATDESEVESPAPPRPIAKAAKAPSPAAPQDATDAVPAPAGPATRRLARELGIDIHHLAGSGPGGRITKEDVLSAVRQSTTAAKSSAAASGPSRPTRPAVDGEVDRDAWGQIRRQPLTKIRRAIAVNMVRSASTIPHVTNFDDADITDLERIRKESAADYASSNVKLTMLAFVTKAAAQSLRLHPLLNASVDLDQEQIIYKEYVNIGVAVDTERGLIVPVIRDADRLTIPQIALALGEVAQRARTGRFNMEELRGGTFTISNLGAVGGAYSTPIINHPEVAILLIGRSVKRAVVMEDRMVPRLILPLSLSYDHRLVDGAAAGRFLNEVISYLQAPGRLLLAS